MVKSCVPKDLKQIPLCFCLDSHEGIHFCQYTQKNESDLHRRMIAANAMFEIFIDVYFAEKESDPWKIGTSIVQTKNGNLYEVTLNIAKTKDGRNILYDVNKIKKSGTATCPQMSITKGART